MKDLILLILLLAAAAAVAEGGIGRNVIKRAVRPGLEPQTYSLQDRPKSSESKFRHDTRTSIHKKKKLGTNCKGGLKESSSGLKKADANVSEVGENQVRIQNITLGDSFQVPINDDPMVSIVFTPSKTIANCALAPDPAQSQGIISEALSIRSHYALLTAEDFHGGVVPPMPGPLEAPPLFQSFRCPEMAVSALMQRIQAPNHPSYPVLSGLGSGSYICTVIEKWASTATEIVLHKP